MAKNKKENVAIEENATNVEATEVVEVQETAKEDKKQKKAKEDSKKNKDKKSKKNPNKKNVAQKSKELYSELKKVSWPSFGKVAKSTGVVLLVVAVCTLILFGADRLFYWLFGLLMG